MVRITKNKMAEVDEKRYSVETVAQAIGRSEGAISGYFSNRGVPTKGGLMLKQIDEFLDAPVRGKIIDWDGVDEIRDRLQKECGRIVEVS